ncbi:hypothetical protein BOA8489_01587 [Boseongicola aestuarii]|uniref:DUF2927 domain-containing protein n=1 Tax=Boseongicola aestuarii TaxID=1470561 RepID=A0A238J0H3_9RHOB|nr:hypothetical protein BOA8489_01587 [Boseongicola aestuarii]
MRNSFAALSVLFALTACDAFPVAGIDGPISSPVSETPAVFQPRTAESLEIEALFQRVSDNLIARGLLRIDGGGPDVPFTDEMVARNFNALAFSEEFSGRGGQLVRATRESTLHKWDQPVRIETFVGPSVDLVQAEQDTAEIAEFAARLSRITGHPIRRVERDGNFQVFVLNGQELRRSGKLLKQFMPELALPQIRFVEDMTPDTYCVVFTSDPEQDGAIQRAIAVIRAELPDRLRTSCVHEEISQGLGLANDSAQARPSIFNDDDEFGRLTYHDELLLQILYDPRLKPGMSEASAAALVQSIATGLLSPST